MLFPPLNLVLQVETMTEIVHHISFLLSWAHCKPPLPAFPVVRGHETELCPMECKQK